MPWPAPTNPCPENQKGKIQKQQNKKNYPSQLATTTSPVVSSYNFFDETHTYITWDSNHLPPTVRVHY